MEKARFETMLDYIDYCTKNDVVCTIRKYSGYNYTQFNDSLEIEGRKINITDKKYIHEEPKSYPAILVYEKCCESGNIYGSFVYPKDFE